MELGVHTWHWGGEIVYTPPAPCVLIDTHEAGVPMLVVSCAAYFKGFQI